MTDAHSMRTPTVEPGHPWLAALLSLAVGAVVPRVVVLAAAAVARLHRGDGRRGTLAMASRDSLRAGIRSCLALRVGLRLDGPRHACPHRPAAAPGGRGLLPLRAQPHVCRLCGRVDRPVGHLRPSRPRLIAAVAAVALGVHLFVVFYEEPTLHNKFGAEYEQYRQNVSRWWPRLRGWNQPQ